MACGPNLAHGEIYLAHRAGQLWCHFDGEGLCQGGVEKQQQQHHHHMGNGTVAMVVWTESEAAQAWS